MALKLYKIILNRYFPSYKVITCRLKVHHFCFPNYRSFSTFKTLHNNKQKLTVKLLPEVEEMLEKGEIKHRQHFGRRKITPIALPEDLRSSVDRILSDENEKLLLEEAEELCNTLKFRRLPIENIEVERRLSLMVPSINDDTENLSEVLNKYQLQIVKRKLFTEMARWKPIEYNARECLAYLIGRLAPNYASTSHVFEELKKKFPSFKPTLYFDFGSGVGSSLWAAHSHWSDTIKEYFCVDTSGDMNDLCDNLITNPVTEEKYISPIFFRQFLPASEDRKYDLVVSAFSLLDLPSAMERLRAIDTLWRKTKDFLIVIEYGNAAGFHCVLDARDYILQVENDNSPEFAYYSSGAYVVSPCPHDSSCPKFVTKQNTSCGFEVPYQLQFPRKLSHTQAKDWISYVILKKGQRPSDDVALPRVVRPVLKRTKHVHCALCCPDGQMNNVIVSKGKHGRHAYRCTRICKEGDILPAIVVPVDISADME